MRKPGLFIIACSLALTGCSSQFKKPTKLSYATTQVTETSLAKLIERSHSASNSNKGGFHLLHDGMDALAAIIYLTNKAEKSLDLQYWSLHQDNTGKAVIYHLLKAADRGVKVRLLLDDFVARGGNANLATLAQHPNIDVKLYNPISQRKWLRTIALLSSFQRANRRMHNKVFVADNSIAIVGGRNIGDAYYSAKPSYLYRDLGVLAIGSVVKTVSKSFDDYWNAKWAVNIKKLNRRLFLRITYKDTRKELKSHYLKLKHTKYWRALEKLNIANKIKNSNRYFTWANYQVLYDPPNKIRGIKKSNEKFLEHIMTKHMAKAKTNVNIITPYFVPQRFGLKWTKQLKKKGVRVSVLTNSFAANDFSLSHGGYQRYRLNLLKNGVSLYEFKRNSLKKKRSKITWFEKKPVSRLHAKSIIIDNRYLYVGSVNLTPRSRYLNTEISIMIDSEKLSTEMNQTFRRLSSKENAYALSYRKTNSIDEVDDGNEEYEITWKTNDRTKNSNQEPEVSLLKHLSITLISLLPIEGLL